MSIYLMSLAWRTKLPANQKMALLAMCDWANDEGGSLHPSIGRVAERLSCSDRQAQRVVHSLIAEGWIAVVGNSNGGAPGASRHYRMNVQKLENETLKKTEPAGVSQKTEGQTGDMGVTGDTGVTGDMDDARRVTPMTQTGDTHVTLSTIEPSIEPPKGERAGARSPRLQPPDDVEPQVWTDWLKLRAAKKAPVTATVLDGARTEAAKAGLTLQAFLQVWCLRGSQGLRAEWLKPDELAAVGAAAPRRPQPGRGNRFAGAAAAIFDGASHV